MKFRYLYIFLLIINLYAFDGIDFYQKGEYQKAEKIFLEYYRETNSTVAKAYLAKIYYKEGKFEKSKKFIKELLRDKSVPDKIKKELRAYLLLMEGKKNIIPFMTFSEKIVYDNNVKWEKAKKSDFAHVEEFLGGGTYLNDNLRIFSYLTLKNKNYFKYSGENYKLFNIYMFLNRFSYINTKIKLGYEREISNSNFYTTEIYFFKKFKNYESGIFSMCEYYENDELNYKNLGGGLRIVFNKKNFYSKVSLSSYYSNYNKNTLDNRNYKIDLKNFYKFKTSYIYMNYYYNFSKYKNFINNFHYFDISFNNYLNKHLKLSIGITKYISLIHAYNYNVFKNEIYTKLSYKF
jgi:hypothetical protein